MKKRLAIGVAIVAIAGAAGFFLFLWLGAYDPEPEEALAVGCTGAPPEIVPGQPFKVLSWNLRLGTSRRRSPNGGPDAGGPVPRQEVEKSLETITAALRNEDPQVALLQEVDRNSRRTHNIDQLARYLTIATDRCHAAAPYHRARYAPGVSAELLGQVDMSLALLTQVELSSAKRIQLPVNDEAWLTNRFDVKPAVLVGEVAVAGMTQSLAVAVTHLSSPEEGGSALDAQIQALSQWMKSRPEGQPWILTGDLNLLPSGDRPERLGAEASRYPTANPMAALLEEQTEVLGDQMDPDNRTYAPFGAQEPDRKLDYFFVGGPIQVVSARVLREYKAVSEHLPIRAELVIAAEPTMTAPAP